MGTVHRQHQQTTEPQPIEISMSQPEYIAQPLLNKS